MNFSLEVPMDSDVSVTQTRLNTNAEHASGKRSQSILGLRLIGIASLLAILGLWWLITARGWIRPLFLPAPVEVIQAARDVGSDLWSYVGATLIRAVGGFLSGTVFGIALGFAIMYDRRIIAALNPIIESWRPVPPVALLPFFLL